MTALHRRILVTGVAALLLASMSIAGYATGAAAQGNPDDQSNVNPSDAYCPSMPWGGQWGGAWGQGQGNGQWNQGQHQHNHNHNNNNFFFNNFNCNNFGFGLPILPIITPYVLPYQTPYQPTYAPVPPTYAPQPAYNTVVTGPPPVPAGLQSFYTSGGPSFTWNAAAGALGYWVYAPGQTPVERNVGATGITFNSVAANTNLCISVMAYNSYGFSSWSGSVCIGGGSPAYSAPYSASAGTPSSGSCQPGYMLSGTTCVPPTPPSGY